MVEKKEKLDVEKKVEETPEGEKPKGKEPEAPKNPKGFDELMNKSVADLTAMAEEKGLDIKSYITKEDAAKAILESE
ncbi:unnamed protein product [marine sediment metagenome]|uniref:Rho termination factor N-terminal domain-containing protein n=1 Tax=marine sediment metagenome TaxID=412755 RepID=X1S2T5_9ZZZZ